MPSLFSIPFPGAHIRDERLLGLAVCVLLAAVAWLALTAYLHRRNLRAVPIRIHVAGSRGKSTVTRMIAAGLRAKGLRVLAKSTGSEPRLILPDGSEQAWRRIGAPSVREHIRFFSRARRMKADAVVVECMAVRPEFLWASETLLVRATTTVITNARPDHYEELGEDPNAMENALAACIPAHGHVVLSDEAATPRLLDMIRRNEANVTIVPAKGDDHHAANRALAAAVCDAIDGEAAPMSAYDAAAPDPAAFRRQEIAVGGKRFSFVNAFSCNDVTSLEMLWERAPPTGRRTVLLNARRDRPLRTLHFLRFLSRQTPRPFVFLSGDPLARRLARRAGFAPTDVASMSIANAPKTFADLASQVEPDAEIWGVGNYHGAGRDLTEHLRELPPAC